MAKAMQAVITVSYTHLCHNERSKGIIARILEKGDTNAYTIEKKGIRKMIYQTAWRRDTLH